MFYIFISMSRKKIQTEEEKKELKRLYDIKYKQKNKDKIKEQNKQYRLLKKGIIKLSCEAKEKLRLYAKQYRLNNPNKHREYVKNRIKNDTKFRLTINIRNLIRNSIYRQRINKNTKTQNILGCSYDEFKQHIEDQFESWMTWDNYGNPKDKIFEPNKTWDIDHIIPISSGLSEEEIIKLNHYTNLKPLCSYYNRWVKRNLN